MIRNLFNRPRCGRAGAALAVLAATLLTLGPALGGAKDSSSRVKVSVKANPPDAGGKQTIQVTIAIDKDWHLYANPVGVAFLDDNATTVTIKPAPKSADIAYPVGTLMKDSGGDYRIYEGQVTIPITLQRAPNQKGAFELSVRVNACTKNTCLLPGTIKLVVP